MNTSPRLSAATKITIAGLVAGAIAIWIQALSGDPAYPEFPPGPVVFLVIAAIIAFGTRWWWTPGLGALVSLMTTVGWFRRLPAELLRLTDPGSVGTIAAGIFIGTLLQIISLLLTDAMGIAATLQNYRKIQNYRRPARD